MRLLRTGLRGLSIRSNNAQREAIDQATHQALTLYKERVVVGLASRSLALAVATTQCTAGLVV